MLNVEDYLLPYKRKLPNLLFLWLGITAFITILIGIINQTFRLNEYYQINGVVKNQHLSVLVPFEKIQKISNKNEIYIGDSKYYYEISSISEEIIQDITGIYQEVFLKIELGDKDFIDNRVVKVKFIIKERTILEYIFSLLRGEN